MAQGGGGSWLATHKDALAAASSIVTGLSVLLAAVSVVVAALTFRFNARNERLRWKANVTAVWMSSSVNVVVQAANMSLEGGLPTRTVMDSQGRVLWPAADAPSPSPPEPEHRELEPREPPRDESYNTFTVLIRNLSFRSIAIVDIAVFRKDGQRADPNKYRRAIALPRTLGPWGVDQVELRIDYHDAGSGPYTLALRDIDFNVIPVERVPVFPAASPAT